MIPYGPFLVAHRGSSHGAPENTLPAFNRALDAGALAVECDVHLTEDGEVVLLHDDQVDRTTNGSGAVAAMSWTEVRQLDAGYIDRFDDQFSGTRVPRLSDLLLAARGRAAVFIEIKAAAIGRMPGGIEERVVRQIRAVDMVDSAVGLSFSATVLRRMRLLIPDLQTGLVLMPWDRFNRISRAVACGARFLFVSVDGIMRPTALTRQAAVSGLRVGVYVVDQWEDARHLISAGVEALGTNRIEDLLPHMATVARCAPEAT